MSDKTSLDTCQCDAYDYSPKWRVVNSYSEMELHCYCLHCGLLCLTGEEEHENRGKR
jgi:hypothetical protein